MCSHYAIYLSHHHNTAPRRRQSVTLSSSLVSMCLVVKCLTVSSLALRFTTKTTTRVPFFPYCCHFDDNLLNSFSFFFRSFSKNPQEHLRDDPVISIYQMLYPLVQDRCPPVVWVWVHIKASTMEGVLTGCSEALVEVLPVACPTVQFFAWVWVHPLA